MIKIGPVHKKIKQLHWIFLTSISLLSFFHTSAQIFNDSSKKFKVYLEPYIMLTSLSGTTGIGILPNTFVCVPASELLHHLKIGGMLFGEVHNDQLAFTSDLFYANLTEDVSGKEGVLDGTITMKQFWWEFEGLYKVNSWLEFGAGGRINNITASADINVITPNGEIKMSNSKSNTWFDPLLVTRIKKVVNEKWLFQLRADIGGFGVGSQFAWQIQPDIFYRLSKLLQFGLGYRIISMDYNNDSGGGDRFIYDMEEYGPQIRIGLNF
jgi:hypothetical protein